MSQLNVLLATSWGVPACGIMSHSDMLIDAVKQADEDIQMWPSAEALMPTLKVFDFPAPIVHLNYHRALHAQWTPNQVQLLKETGKKVIITWHDSYGESEPDQLTKNLYALADAFIVHEPCQGLPEALYWRQGVPELSGRMAEHTKYHHTRPIVGTVGFDLPWKNLDLLCRIAGDVGWGVLLYVPEMTPERQAYLHALNPWLTIRINDGLQDVVAGLHQCCAATAFLYQNGNSGTSAAIRLGIAARKRVIAFSGQRQFRDLADSTVIDWCRTVEDVESALMSLPTMDWYPPMVALAERDSWRSLGQRYAQLYRSLVS